MRTQPVAGNFEASSTVIVPAATSADTTFARNRFKSRFTFAGSTVTEVSARLPMHENRSALNVNADVELAEPGTLPRFEGKAKRVVDRRTL